MPLSPPLPILYLSLKKESHCGGRAHIKFTVGNKQKLWLK